MDNDLSPLREALIGIHEMFRELVASGFTEFQACVIIGNWMAASGK